MVNFLKFDGVDDYLKIPTFTYNRVVLDVLVPSGNDLNNLLTSASQFYLDSGNSIEFVNCSSATVDGVSNSRVNGDAFWISYQPDKRIVIDATLYSASSQETYLFSFSGSSANASGNLYKATFYNDSTIVASYDMSTGNVKDISGNGYDAILYGGTFVRDNRGYRLYEPVDKLNPLPYSDNLIKTFIEGVDYSVSDTSILFTETLENSTFLNGGETEYRYFIAFDDENISEPSNIFSIVNLMPPTGISLTTVESDEIDVTYVSAQYASGYKYKLTNMTTGEVIIDVLPQNGAILSLDASTTYKIQLASMNSSGDITEWTSEYQAMTGTIFGLTANISSGHIEWTWTNNDSGITLFELTSALDNSVIYSGTDYSYAIDSATQKYQVFVKATYTDLRTRITRTADSDVYTDFSIGLQFSQDATSIGTTRAESVIDLYQDSKENISLTNNTFRDFVENRLTQTDTFNDQLALTSYRLSLYNYRSDVQYFSNDFKIDKTDKMYAKTDTFAYYKENTGIDFTTTNNLIDNYIVKNSFRMDKTETLPFKSVTLNSYYGILTSKITTFQADKIVFNPKFYIKNSRTTQYGIRLTNYNDTFTNVSPLRQKVFNPTKPFDVDNVDLIINATISNIDIQSQVNKVRILCLGDSITAGAPLYDPQYGGTVWMPDLITGKVKTRNVKESEYPYWLQVRLGIDDFEVINEGSGRRTSAEVQFHVEEQMLTYKPEYVIVMIGTNDIFSAQDSGTENLANTVATTLTNIRKTIDKIIEYGGTPILGTQLPRNSIVPIEAKNALRNLNSGIKNLGIEYGMDVIDWYDTFVVKDSNGVETGVLRYDVSGDDTHPTIEGYKLMAYTINLGIFNSFRASFRVFGGMLGTDVDYSKEEQRQQPDPYTFNYTITFPELRRLQSYVFSKYIKNTGNSWGLFVLDMTDKDNICQVWDEKNKVWADSLIGQLAPNQIMELKLKYTMPATGTNKEVDFNIDYIVKR